MRMMGDYIVGDTLGEGGFSFVKLGIHKSTKERVALKMLKKDKLNLSASVKKQVEREIVAMEKIKHKNVICLKNVDWDAQFEKKNGSKVEVILVVLELANGGELFEFLSFTGPFSENVTRTYFHQLIDGVSYCHSQGVCHRDLKPENLLLDDNFVLKLADFGFSNVFQLSNAKHATIMHTECGTPGYMAPEMFSGKGYDAVSADIWACGVILFIMLAGFPPFQKPDMRDWWFNKLATNKHSLFWQAHSRSANFSENFKDLINRILQPDSSKRITIADIKKHPWFEGSVVSDAAIINEFTRRKNTVTEAKARIEAEKEIAAKAKMAQEASKGGELGNGEVFRDLEGGGAVLINPKDMLPIGNPAFISSFELPVKSVDDVEEPQQIVFNPFSVFASLNATEDAEPELYNPTISCFTTFESTSKPSDLLKKIETYFKDLNATYSMDEKRYVIKPSIMNSTGVVVLSGQIFRHPSKQDLLVVEFRRRQGHVVHYRSIFDGLLVKLGSLVAPHTVTAPKFTESKEESKEESKQNSSSTSTSTTTTTTTTATATTTVTSTSSSSLSSSSSTNSTEKTVQVQSSMDMQVSNKN